MVFFKKSTRSILLDEICLAILKIFKRIHVIAGEDGRGKGHAGEGGGG